MIHGSEQKSSPAPRSQTSCAQAWVRKQCGFSSSMCMQQNQFPSTLAVSIATTTHCEPKLGLPFHDDLRIFSTAAEINRNLIAPGI